LKTLSYFLGICWDFDSAYKSFWLNRLLFVWCVDIGKINYFHIGVYRDFENLSLNIFTYDNWKGVK
jgi:hypothetical protein